MTRVIAMWSGPRNISTTMMRSFANRGDMAALDEPFYACYLARSKAVHPYREETLAAYPATFGGALDWIAGETARPFLFLKHIAYHLDDDADFSFLDGWRNFLLIRDPRAMVASFSNKFEDVTPIIRSYRVMRAIHAHLALRHLACPIIDAADILTAPEPMLRALSAALAIDFDPAMLAWRAGPRPEDGPWAPHWYDAVRASTGFKQPVDKAPELSDALEEIAAAAADDYRFLRERRLSA